MQDGIIEVFAAESAASQYDGWKAYEKANLSASYELAEFLDRFQRDGSGTLIDLSDTPIAGAVLANEQLEEYMETGGTVLLKPWSENTNFLISPERIVSGRVVLFVPLVYEPVFVETSRLIGENTLGGPAGIEITRAGLKTRMDVLFLVCLLFGEPSGLRQACGAKRSDFLWFGARGCSITFADDGGQGRDDALEMKMACRKGQITVYLAERSRVAVQPAGREPYRLPLPDGNGIYYNRRDAIDIASTRRTTRVYSAAVVAAAYTWVQESVHEGT